VHHPPARVLLPWGGEEARALDARGYRVTTHGDGAVGIHAAHGAFLDGVPDEFDLVCETGGYAALSDADRFRYVDVAARALRPGGLLFGAFPGGSAGALLTQLGARFDAARLEPSAFGEALLEAVFVRR
jgi:hypothetical protein